ncbi:MAG: acyl-CoA synthetase FdrA [Chloroflexi bacterium]|nr:acyl-CoA synthetase FdrA [Chloroflexota bacterium]
MTTKNLVLKNSYRDSVVLMRLSQDLEQMDGIQQATIIMGTDNNKTMLDSAGLLMEDGSNAGANDLIVAVRLSSSDAEPLVMERVHEALDSSGRDAETGLVSNRPRTIDGALTALPGSNLALISVPGQYAAYEATKALDRGLHVVLFSDNVSIEDEVELKNHALSQGLFMLGPDCGTAIINGVPLGFANAVPRGRVGLVSASGAGLQQVTCLLAAQGHGISQALGVGSRDLSDQVGGIMMLEGIRVLNDDPDTDVIALISKPPGPMAQQQIAFALRVVTKPCVVCFLGMDAQVAQIPNVYFEMSLHETASRVMSLLGDSSADTEPIFPPPNMTLLQEISDGLGRDQRYIRGLYSGGTLAYESLLFLRDMNFDISSNLDMPLVNSIDDDAGRTHNLIDMGDDQFTQGVPHPMIDYRQRRERIVKEATNPEVGIILLDVMLGFGSHADPASELVPAINEARLVASGSGRQLAFIVVLCGTPDDPQDIQKQHSELTAAGAVVVPSNLQAVSIAAALSVGDLELIQGWK